MANERLPVGTKVKFQSQMYPTHHTGTIAEIEDTDVRKGEFVYWVQVAKGEQILITPEDLEK